MIGKVYRKSKMENGKSGKVVRRVEWQKYTNVEARVQVVHRA